MLLPVEDRDIGFFGARVKDGCERSEGCAGDQYLKRHQVFF